MNCLLDQMSLMALVCCLSVFSGVKMRNWSYCWFMRFLQGIIMRRYIVRRKSEKNFQFHNTDTSLNALLLDRRRSVFFFCCYWRKRAKIVVENIFFQHVIFSLFVITSHEDNRGKFGLLLLQFQLPTFEGTTNLYQNILVMQ